MKICFAKLKITSDMIGQYCLYPCYNSDAKFLNRCKEGKPELMSHRESRNPKHHKLIFAIARCIKDQLPENNILKNFSNKDLIKAIMYEEKIVDEFINIDGTKRFEAKHLNFEDMDEREFIPVSDAMFKWGAHLLNIEESELRENYKEYL